MPYIIQQQPMPESEKQKDITTNKVFRALNVGVPIAEGIAYILANIFALNPEQDSY